MRLLHSLGDTVTDTHVLYRFYSATGQLLYVGITMNPPNRFKSHRDSKEWWGLVSGITVENYRSRKELMQAERRAIKVERPKYNIVHNKQQKTPAQKKASTCSWFKPMWYGEAREAGRTRRLKVAEGERIDPWDDVDDQGRVLVTWAPRPSDWIEKVDRFRAMGLTDSRIEHFVRCTMASPAPPDDLWESFSRRCYRAIDSLLGVSL